MALIQGEISAFETFSEPGRLYSSTGRLHYIRADATGRLHYIHAGATGRLRAQQTTSHLSGH